MTEKACSKCGVISPNFRADKTGFLGLRSKCRPCDRERDSAYKKANRSQTRLHRQCWRAGNRARAAGTGGYVNAHEWAGICDAFGHRCAYCGAQPEGLTLDHVVPLSAGGRNETSNIVPACHECNSQKSGRSLLDFVLVWTNPFLPEVCHEKVHRSGSHQGFVAGARCRGGVRPPLGPSRWFEGR